MEKFLVNNTVVTQESEFYVKIKRVRPLSYDFKRTFFEVTVNYEIQTDELYAWCEKNVSEYWIYDTRWNIYFSNKDDAMLFRLVWG